MYTPSFCQHTSVCRLLAVCLTLALTLNHFTAHADDASDNEPIYILAIGNSYTIDALAYLPFVAQNLSPGIDIKVGILFRGGATLARHWSCLTGWPSWTTSDNSLYYYEYDNGQWITITPEAGLPNYDIAVNNLLTRHNWNFVFLQQGSTHSANWANYKPYLDYTSSTSIPKWLTVTKKFNGTLAWILTPAYPDGYNGLNTALTTDGTPPLTGDRMFYAISDCAQRVMNLNDNNGKKAFKLLLPCGTAVQNARTCGIDTIGRFGHMSYDGLHLQEGLPSLIECYTAAAAIFSYMGIDWDLGDDFLYVDVDWIKAVGKMGTRGEAIAMNLSDPYRVVARQCVLAALADPYEITSTTIRTIVPSLATATPGAIIVNGNSVDAPGARHTAVYTPNGQCVATQLPATLPCGTYIAVADGHSRKIRVR